MPDDAPNPLLDWLVEDARSFTEIARSWSKAADDFPAAMMNDLVSAFWRGDFERDGETAIFALLQPGSPHAERTPGNYATRADGIVKIGADLRGYLTAERKKGRIFRRVVAEVLCRDEWDGSDDGYLGLATIPFEKWSMDMRELYYSQWRIQRRDFAKWYGSTALTTEMGLGAFWPEAQAGPKRAQSRPEWEQTSVSDTAARAPTRGRTKGSGSYDAKDAPLLEEMRQLIVKGDVVSPEAAAKRLAHHAYGAGAERSKRDRLAKRFRAKYGSNMARIKSD